MIREHAFNTEWWGSPVGFLDDAAFFDLTPKEQEQACAAFAWVEYAAALDAAPAPERLGRAGFHWVDTQIPFRIDLAKIPSTPSIQQLSAITAEQQPFAISAPELSFERERFRFLPGISAERLNARYALWSNRLIAQHPAWCLRISDGSAVQGWFLSEPHPDKPLNLTLAMLTSDAQISGHALFQKAIVEFAARGARVGAAAFSVSNTSVMNIYANLGARFLPVRGYWMRYPARDGGTVP